MGNIIIEVEKSWIGSDEHKACSLAGLRCIASDELSSNAVGLGSVNFCQAAHKWPACDPYPKWLPWGRKIYRDNEAIPDTPSFYKPADTPKRFASALMTAPPSGAWVASEPVEFMSEFRAYVVNGKVLGVFCYSDFDNTDVPVFPWLIPNSITAAIDFGISSKGLVLPVEVNDPYAIGWYGTLSQYRIYADFIIAGWSFMLLNKRGKNKTSSVE
jgi:hypothetical protein